MGNTCVRLASWRVVTGDGAPPRPLTLEVVDGRITAVAEGIADDATVLDGLLVPGFVDTHCHGGAGADLTDPDPSGVAAAVAHHRRHGSTTVVASTVTAGLDHLVDQVHRLAPLVEAGELGGIHLEGPFLSPRHQGAHATELLVAPTAEAVDALLAAGHGTVRMVTLAPELPGGLEAIARLRAAGVVAAVGHTDADDAACREAVDAGATVATHLFNAMRPLHHRAPGPAPVLLDDQRVTVEVIADFVHVDPEVVRMVVRAAGTGRVSLVTDAMSATGCADGDYQLGALPVVVTDGTARLATDDGSPGAIAGSTLTMDVAVAHLGRLGVAPQDVARMASANPARALGLDDVGLLEPGRWADVCVLDPGSLELRSVLRRGLWVVPHEGREWKQNETQEAAQ